MRVAMALTGHTQIEQIGAETLDQAAF
jgi:isopentenyl diphosphate isomerase/L-lactate dehydrogenase-like FMN-dependent dehydrogenase